MAGTTTAASTATDAPAVGQRDQVRRHRLVNVQQTGPGEVRDLARRPGGAVGARGPGPAPARRGQRRRQRGPPAATRGSCAPTSSRSSTSILFAIGAALLALGRYNDAFISVGLGLVNAAISAVQEIRAKRKLDRLQLLSREPWSPWCATAGTSRCAPEEVVRGDVVHVRPGDQIVVDGPVLDGGRRRGRRVAAHRGVRAAAEEAGRRPAVGQLQRRRGGTPARPRRRRGQLRQPADRRGPAGHDRRHAAAAPDRVRRPAGDAARGADERDDPVPGRARGVHAGPRRADHRGAVGAGALRPVLPRRRRLHRRRREERRRRGARPAGQRRGVGEQRRRRLHRQDRHADHRPARAWRRCSRSAPWTPRPSSGWSARWPGAPRHPT